MDFNAHKAALDEATKLVGVLIEDMNKLIALKRESGDSQALRRAFVRTDLAFVEGNLNCMTDVILKAIERGDYVASVSETANLREEIYTLKDNGQAQSQTRFSKLEPRLKFVTSQCAKCHGKSFSLDSDSLGWQSFRDAVEIRNRITHPRTLSGVEVSDDDLAATSRARKWLGGNIKRLFDICNINQFGPGNGVK